MSSLSSPAVVGSGDANIERQNVANDNQHEMSIGLCGARNAREEDYEEEGGVRIGDIYIPPPPPPACTFDPTGPRLIITKMEIENFKSYAQKVVLGPFNKNFTAVIGPNGSGKSNVIDAMLFVFGYRAQRIRSKKLSALIHKSENFPNCSSCTVAVHFSKIIDAGEAFTTVEGSAFVVSRTAFRDDTSYYCIDGRRLLFKEVAKILRNHGIDLDHSRFLILQGEVEHIAMMKPKGTSEHDTGMLEFLEDIIGCHRLKEPIEMLFQQVEELNEVKSQKMERVKVVQKDLDELRKAKDEAMKYIVLKNEIVRKDNARCQKLIFECSVLLKQIVDAKTKYEEEMSGTLKEADEIRALCETQGKEYKKYQSGFEKLSKKHERMQEEFAELERNDLRIVQSIQHNKAKLATLQENRTIEEKKLRELTDSPASHAQEIETLEKKLLKLNDKKKMQQENLVAVMSKLKEETKSFQEKKIEQEHALLGLRNIVDTKKSAMCIAQSELDIYKSSKETVATLLDKLRRDYDDSIRKGNEKQESIMKLKAEIEQLQADVQRDKEELEKITVEIDLKKELVKDARTKTQQATESLQSHRSRGRILNYVLDLKAKGVVQGIYGRLGDLGAIDAKYDVAVSMACGLLDHIVVDDVEIAEKCIQHLRRDNIGRASFIALDKMQVWNQYVNKKISTPENSPRLFDLITVSDERHLPAFYFALRDTLVAEEINQATRIAFGSTRYRVVTLQGHIIEQSGAMSGGGTQVSRNRMGRTVAACDYTQSQVEKMQQDLEKLNDEVRDLVQRKLEISQKVESGSARLPQLSHALQMSEMENRSLSEQVSSLKLQVKEQERRAKSVVCDAAELARMQTVLDNAMKDHKKAEVDAVKVEEKVKRLDDEIAKISGDRVESAQTQIDDVCKKMDAANGNITKLKAAIKTTTRNAKKCEEKIQKLHSEIKNLGDEVKDLGNQCKQNEEKAKVYIKKLAETLALKDSEKKNGDGLRKELNVLQEKESKLSSQTLKYKHQMEEYDRRIGVNREKIQSLEVELSKLVLQETDDNPDTVLPRLSAEALEELNEQELLCSKSIAQSELAKLKPNAAAIEEYRKKEAIYLQRVAELEDITNRRNSKRQVYDGLKKQRLNEFMDGFKIISYKLRETYQMITLGGDAELELANSLDPFSEGIVFTVRPPRKSWKCISNLSGGEKTLSSLALVFALHYYKPTPLYVMDEIDAALDYRNVSIIGYYIKERTKNAQFIIISLRNNMFELADTLVGIYKTFNSSKSVMVNLPKGLTSP